MALAAAFGLLQISRTLLTLGHDVNDKDIHGDTALAKASYYGHVALVDFLLRKGASIDGSNRRQKTSLHLAAERGTSPID